MLSLKQAVRGTLVAAAVIAVSAAFTAPANPHPGSATVGSIARQLGVKVPGKADEEFELGVQFTGLLEEPGRLAAFGIKGMHAGARVVAARIAADRVYIEADEVDPVRRESSRVAIGLDGTLVKPPKD